MNRLSESERRRVADLYHARIKRHGLSVEALKSGGAAKQWVRHSIHWDAFDFEGRHVLDVGCGIAMFYRFLMGRGVRLASYTGIDIVETFLDSNRAAFPQARFLHLDIFEDSLEQLTPDIVVMSQVFNNTYHGADNEHVVRHAIRRFFETAREGLAIDFMSTYVDWREDDLHYFEPESMFAFAKSLTRFVELRHDYLPFEHTLILRKAPRYGLPAEDDARAAYGL